MGTTAAILNFCLHSTHTSVMTIMSRISLEPWRSSRVAFVEVKGHGRWYLATTVSALSLSFSWLVVDELRGSDLIS